MKKKQDVSGLIFSAFMVIAFVVCSYFFIGLIDNSTALGEIPKHLCKSLVCVLFGALLFYATRIGDGKQVKRFSVATLVLLDLPALYVILASVAQGLPFPMDLSKAPEMVLLAAVALGYGIPYTFLSGYELESDKKGSKEEKKDEEEKSDEEETAEEADEEAADASGETEAEAENAEPADAETTGETDADEAAEDADAPEEETAPQSTEE